MKRTLAFQPSSALFAAAEATASLQFGQANAVASRKSVAATIIRYRRSLLMEELRQL
jgi:hypothetical protein